MGAFTLFVFYFVEAEAAAVSVSTLYALWSVDMVINSLCLFLNFIFSDPVYKRLCAPAHAVCQSAIKWVATKKILDEHFAKNIDIMEHTATDLTIDTRTVTSPPVTE